MEDVHLMEGFSTLAGGCLLASVASTHQMLVLYTPTPFSYMTKNVSSHCQMSPGGK